MNAVVTAMAYVLTCLVVATLWSIIAALWSSQDISFSMFLVRTSIIFGLLITVSALPVLVVYAVAARHCMINYRLAALAGFFLGAGLFVVFFAAWTSESRVQDYIKLIGLGGGLGMFGGVIFVFCKYRLYQMVSTR